MEQSVSNELKRYNLVISAALFNDLQSLADREGTTVVELLRKSIKIILLISKFDSDPLSKNGVFIKDDGKEHKLVIM